MEPHSPTKDLMCVTIHLYYLYSCNVLLFVPHTILSSVMCTPYMYFHHIISDIYVQT